MLISEKEKPGEKANTAARRFLRNRLGFIRVHLCASVVSTLAVSLFAANEVGERFTAAYHAGTAAGHEHFGGTRPGIVIRRLDEAVRPRSPKHEQIIRSDFSQRPVLEETIAGFTHRAN